MKNIRLGLLITLLAGLLMACADEIVIEPAELVDLDAAFKPRKVWSADAGDGAGELYSRLQPALGFGKLFTADADGKVFAFDPETGKRIWEYDTQSAVAGGIGVGESLVLVGSKDGEVIALDPESGAEKWRNLVSSEVIAPPAAGSGKVIVHSVDGKLFAMNAETGERDWFYDRSVPILTLRGTSAPVIAPGGAVLAGFANGKVAAFLIEDGRLAWEHRVTAPSGRSELQRLVDVDSDPLIYDGVLYVVGYNGNMAAVDLRNGATLWNRELSAYRNISADADHIYVTHDDSYVSALDRASGAVAWTNKELFHRDITGPTKFGPYLVVGDFDGYLHWLNADDGSFVARNRVDGSGVGVEPLASGGELIAIARDGTLAAFRVPADQD